MSLVELSNKIVETDKIVLKSAEQTNLDKLDRDFEKPILMLDASKIKQKGENF